MWKATPVSSVSVLGQPTAPWSPLCFTPPTQGCVRSGPFRSARYSRANATSSMVGVHTHKHRSFIGGLLATWPCLSLWYLITALTSPIEYQRNHVGASGGSCVPSTGAPVGGSSGSSAPPGVGGGSSQASAIPSGPQGGSRRPSRIPQPSRLPQPLRLHPGADTDGPNKMSGMERLSICEICFVK